MAHNDDSSNDNLEKTSIVASDTFRGRLKEADEVPPAIVVLIGPPGYVGKQYPITANDIVIGRSVESQVYIDDKSLSRSHAKFAVNGSEVSVIDLGSTNKTIVNGQVIPPLASCLLKNNDQIKTGNVIFKFLEKGSIEAMTNAAMYERAQKDALTGAHSKGALLEKGPEAMKRAEVLNEPLSLVTFDIDHFKKINDNYGHPGGDHVLKELCRIVITKLIRSNDFFARYGGEEFVLLLSGSPSKTAGEVGERIRQTIEAHEFVFENKKIPVTISVGVATKLPQETEWTQIYDRADKALYQSKQGGRNKVTIAP
ncbi:diguanylate cyclase [Bdellovibrio bacteriovorus]|uniref:diguanylate cyclase n=1 Tax=Bdellovibrio bacteriovorus TaxID=959 RepID=A0A150WII0_BDEBC|nr:diguanylate cyclase [Bdellovibrio bacteriovorus]KYG63424.1 diguanylate cyclase [Bdellovibrio bacteriovorus]